MPKEPPVVIRDGSLKIECDEPVDLRASTISECDPLRPSPRPFKYKHRNPEFHIRRVVIENGEGRVVFNEAFEARQCKISIYWDPDDPFDLPKAE